VPVPILPSSSSVAAFSGAFKDDRMVGFCTRCRHQDGKPSQWSHMLGVVDEFRAKASVRS
jgi:predicted GNAT superfamily acetyltransferase